MAGTWTQLDSQRPPFVPSVTEIPEGPGEKVLHEPRLSPTPPQAQLRHKKEAAVQEKAALRASHGVHV